MAHHRWFLVGLAITGCDRVFGLNPPPVAPSDSTGDAPPCVTPTLHDSFDSVSPCSAWGFTDEFPPGKTTVSTVGGELIFTFAADEPAARAGCLSLGQNAFTPESGVFVESGTTVIGGEYKFISAELGTGETSYLSWTPGSLELTRGLSGGNSTFVNSTPFDPVETRWVRMRPLEDRSAIVAETAPDGLQWTEFARDVVTAPTQVRVTMIGGTFSTLPGPGSISFSGLNTCP